MADTKLSALTELAATPAVDDELYIRDVSEAAADESKRITTANLLAAVTGAKATSGSYTGDDSANRAIPHGLGVTPKLVVIVDAAPAGIEFQHFRIIDGSANVYPANAIEREVTAMDATNFYVGNAALYEASANGNARALKWVAIG